MGPYNAPTITEPFTLYDMQLINNKENFNNIDDSQIQPSRIIISPYLEKYIKLWVWDWDDTLLDSSAYIRHYMDRNTIIKLTDEQLEFDIPNYKYFKDIVEYLVSTGRRVGFASFGTYSVIRAYMDRIFGFGQKIFTEINIYAACRDIDGTCEVRTMPLNKNSYIQRLMQLYAINNPKDVVLFDDRPSNISDAARMGVIPIQINSDKLNNNNRNNLQAKASILFGPTVMMDLEARIRGLCKDNPTEYDKSFGQLGDFKVSKYAIRNEGHINNKTIQPNFNIDTFNNIINNNKNMEKDKKNTQTTNIDKLLEGFTINDTGFFNNSYIDYMHDTLCGISLFKDDKCIDNFSNCMSCKSYGSTYLAGGLFIIMILLIISMFYI